MFDAIVSKATEFYTVFMSKAPEFFFALLSIIVFYYIAKYSAKLVTYNLRRFAKKRHGLATLLSGTTFTAVFLIGLFIALSILNLSQAVTSLLAGVGIVGIALGFAFQDIAANYISGIIIAVQRPFKEGDLLKTNDYFGKVTDIDLRSTTIVTLDGLDVIIPNKDVLQNPLTNYTHTNFRRVDLTVGVSYAEDLEHVKKVTIDAVKKVKPRDMRKEVELFYDEFDDSSINFIVRFWIENATQLSYRTAKSAAIMNIKAAYNKEGITIPFPIRTLDFGIKGGKTFKEMK